MKLQKHIKEIFITISVISITAVTYAALTTVSNGDPLTSTAWNNMVNLVNTNETKLTNISSVGGNVGIGTTSPKAKLSVGFGNEDQLNVYSPGDNQLSIQTSLDGQVIGTYGGNAAILHIQPTAGMVSMVTGGGNVGIGTTTPTQKLDVAGNINTSGNIYATGHNYINNTSPTTFYQDTDERSAMIHVNSNLFYVLRGCGINSATWCPYNGRRPLYINLEDNSATFGGTVAATAFNTYSDKRLKKNIVTLDNSLEKVSKLRGVSFDWKDTGKKELGLIAQEVEEVYPDIVNTDDKGMKSVKYSNLVAPLIESVKELKKENEELKKRVEALENK